MVANCQADNINHHVLPPFPLIGMGLGWQLLAPVAPQ